MANLRDQVDALSPAEKVDLLDALWESLEADAPLTDEQRAELDYRMARYDESPADVISWEQVKASLLRNR